ncbi:MULTISPECIES: hypothetical protein [unclassified Variovorax]|jgi:hypothetical protein|uniref:hypothetical protein n=1 Tax=unclassified Variovorax TaxID=663243 RepID=UPI000F7F8365|nr:MULTISPECIES: hypothetical protein [unclassified Variovorax]RSZ45667.1 hypothetical protein EJO70_04185 [Variovorax sp. 553]RSZ46878.1 hypothetical protein EJO71_07125 [Variovorax sp. 679]
MKQQQHHQHHGFWRMWGWPITLGLLTVFGLISALFSDGGLGDVLAWFALGIPVVVCAWYGWRKAPAGKS